MKVLKTIQFILLFSIISILTACGGGGSSSGGGAGAPGTASVTVTLSSVGTGTGTVTSNPAGISCPGTCTFSFPVNQLITLTATPAAGSSFASWGADCGPTSGSTVNGNTCSGTPGPNAPSTIPVTATFSSVAVSINPATVTVGLSGVQSFTASVTGGVADTSVKWAVQEATGCGSIAGGTYAAPPSITGSTATCHLVATSVADPTQKATATVTVTTTPTVSVGISPNSAALITATGGNTQQFTATVTGNANTSVTWSVNPGTGCGSVNGSGLYTAPATAATCTVTATSVADITKFAPATVTVSQVSVSSVNPSSVTVSINAAQSFSATVTGTSNHNVTWTVLEGASGGTITSGGVYTAPGTAGGPYHVVATSIADPTQSAQATVTVTTNQVVSITINPPGPVTLNTGGSNTQQFTAPVTGNANTSVTWSVSPATGCGSVSGSGLYTAPATATTCAVIATSVADNTKTASASVTVKAISVSSVTPSNQSVITGLNSTAPYAATVLNSVGSTAITWSLNPASGCGSINSATGVYTSPNAPTTCSATIIATSAADTSKTGTAVVTVVTPSITGTISYSGSKTGRIYLSVSTSGCTSNWAGCTPYGVSIPAPGSYPANFTIRGVPAGTYTINAFMDIPRKGSGWGVPNAQDPTGSVTNISTNGSTNTTGAAITLTDPPATTAVPPTGVQVFPMNNGAFINFKNVKVNGVESVDGYRVYADSTLCSDSPARGGNGGGCFGLTNGSHTFTVTSYVGASESAPSSGVTVTVGALTGGYAISGNVTLPSAAPAGANLLVIACAHCDGSSTPPAFFGNFISNPSGTTIPYSISGLSNGTYSLFVSVDNYHNGLGDWSTTNGNVFINPQVTISSANISNFPLSVPGTDSRYRLTTATRTSDGVNLNYQVNLELDANAKLPVNVAITSGNIPVPADLHYRLNPSAWGSFINSFWNGPVDPSGNYSLAITYSDGTSATIPSIPVTVLPAAALATPVQLTNGSGVLQPTFQWSAPTSPLLSYVYFLELGANGGSGIWDAPNNNYYGLPSGTLSALYNFDGTASVAALTKGTTYTWGIDVLDHSTLNLGVYSSTYTP